MTTRKTDTTTTPQTCCIPVPIERAARNSSAHTTGVLKSSSLPANHVDSEAGFVSLEGGWFLMGAEDGPHPEDGEGPVREVWVDAFSIQTTCITNAQFARFIAATQYKTQAEQQGHSFVFHLFDKTAHAQSQRVQHATWWHCVINACWHCPEGSESTIDERLDHPVVHVSLADTQAYCVWANCRLPTEAEWEFAARGGLQSTAFPWGDELQAGNVHRANLWQGSFPDFNSSDDGFAGTAPVRSFKPNHYGLYNVIGNVWEWTADRHTRLHSPRAAKNPKGPLNGDKYVAKGGSYLCHKSYCSRYRNSGRQALAAETIAGNIGFRVAAATKPGN